MRSSITAGSEIWLGCSKLKPEVLYSYSDLVGCISFVLVICCNEQFSESVATLHPVVRIACSFTLLVFNELFYGCPDFYQYQ